MSQVEKAGLKLEMSVSWGNTASRIGSDIIVKSYVTGSVALTYTDGQ